MTIEVWVTYYAAARELAGQRSEKISLSGPSATQEALRSALAEHHPSLSPHLPRMRLAINGDFADPEAKLASGDRVDLLPPVAGGSAAVTLCRLEDAPLSVDEAMRAVDHPGAGGIAVFAGVVRDHAEGKVVARLDYEAHETLAETEMGRVLAAVVEHYPGARLAAVHRVGKLAVGDLAVVVAASAPHRGEAFDACRDAIDAIKETVPIWKHEWDPDGNAHWVNLED